VTAAVGGFGSILNPVPGAELVDSFGNCRGANCERAHAGIDIFAPEGTPVVAPVAGTVIAEGQGGRLGGIRVWLRGAVDNLAYYFAHLSSENVTVGDQLLAGEQLGTVGSTGNAAGGPPHLHFSINRVMGDENPVVNPYDVISRDATAGGGLTPPVDAPSSDASNGTAATAMPAGFSLNPFSWFDKDNWILIGSTIGFVGAGLALVVIGVVKTADPSGQKRAALRQSLDTAATSMAAA